LPKNGKISAIGLGSQISERKNDPFIDRELQDLRRFLPENVFIPVGGRAARNYHRTIEATRAILINELGQLQIELARISASR
jgi:hypothetical protein